MVNTQTGRLHTTTRPPLTGSLGLANRLISAAETVILRPQSGEPGDIELPPVLGAQTDQAQLRTASPLYLCSELESAQLLPVVEKLSGLFALGGLQADPGRGGPLLAAFWQKRNERFTAPERKALFARLFGSSDGSLASGGDTRNDEFLPQMIELAGALNHLSSDPIYGRTPSSEESVRVAAETLASNLVPRAGGITLFAAREITNSVHEAIAILETPSVQAIVGQHTLWGAVGMMSRLYLGAEPDVTNHLDAGRAGALILAWVAEISPSVENSPVGSLVPDESIISAAATWLSATMALQHITSTSESPAGSA
jgi:hypothetical protein